SRNGLVQVMSADGRLLTRWGASCCGARRLDSPAGVALDRDGNVFVADPSANRVHVFDPAGQPLASWGQPGGAPGELAFPYALAAPASSAAPRAWPSTPTAPSTSPTAPTTGYRS